MNSDGTPLQLLLADASVDELEAHRASLEPSAEVESEAGRALQLQARLRDRSKRTASLAALSDLASRLTSTRELAELLHDIAVQARQLMRTDVTYLALLEEDAAAERGRRLRIPYSDGLLGGSAREIRLSTTSGLAGRIIEASTAASTEDYLNDATISRPWSTSTGSTTDGSTATAAISRPSSSRTTTTVRAPASTRTNRQSPASTEPGAVQMPLAYRAAACTPRPLAKGMKITGCPCSDGGICRGPRDAT